MSQFVQQNINYFYISTNGQHAHLLQKKFRDDTSPNFKFLSQQSTDLLTFQEPYLHIDIEQSWLVNLHTHKRTAR